MGFNRFFFIFSGGVRLLNECLVWCGVALWCYCAEDANKGNELLR